MTDTTSIPLNQLAAWNGNVAFPDQTIRNGDFTNSGTLGTGGLKLDASSVNWTGAWR
jgi:hypothetical protein